jgi:hypothetical protein
MKRDYAQGERSDINFFTGVEVEHTPAYGMNTLFVTGIQTIDAIELLLATNNNIKHIFFGANHSFNPATPSEWDSWEEMIVHFLENEYLCSLDIPLSAVESFNDGSLNEFDNFIPQIRVPVPYIKLWNYNTMIKIDDKGFKATNPGVWSHSLHSLTNRENFTDWSKYKDDKII